MSPGEQPPASAPSTVSELTAADIERLASPSSQSSCCFPTRAFEPLTPEQEDDLLNH